MDWNSGLLTFLDHRDIDDMPTGLLPEYLGVFAERVSYGSKQSAERFVEATVSHNMGIESTSIFMECSV
jgi:hypothetical protein